MTLHTILGANGTIAKALFPILKEKGENIRLVSRNPKSAQGAETVVADMLDREAVFKAVKGSSVVYLVLGIQYDAKIWKRDWPIIMRNVIDACKENKARFVFFDDAYMYGKVEGIITEETPYLAASKKGRIRAEVARMLQKEMRNGVLKALIARAVDFYGPGVTDKSAPGVYVFSNLKKGKNAMWPINANVPRSFNYVPDAAKALYMLATDDKAYGQVWHLPSVLPAPTGKEFVKIAAGYMNGSEKVRVLPKWFMKVLGWFNPFLREAYELNYQDEYPFQFSSEKFEKAYDFIPTSYEEGIKETAEWFLKYPG